jgi:SAM-dependent methyltransferase
VLTGAHGPGRLPAVDEQEEEMQTGSGTASQQSVLWGSRARDWADVQEHTVLPLFTSVLDAVLTRPGVRLLDIGCGAGLASQLAAQRGAVVSGFDATEPLLAIARERTPQADFRSGDMEQLPYTDGEFDAVVGFNSFQFAARPAGALREARRVARPRGPVAAAIWGRPEQCEAQAVLQSLGTLLPPPPPGAPSPFALSAPGVLEATLTKAGLTAEGGAEVECPWRYPDLATALRGIGSAGPAVAASNLLGRERVDEVLAAALAPYRTADGGYELRNVFRYVVARA